MKEKNIGAGSMVFRPITLSVIYRKGAEGQEGGKNSQKTGGAFGAL